jgi:hypothetical protein
MTAKRGRCSVCGTGKMLDGDGNVKPHDHPRIGQWCPGSGKPPKIP